MGCKFINALSKKTNINEQAPKFDTGAEFGTAKNRRIFA